MSTNEKPNAGASGQKAPWTVKRIAAPGAGKLFRFSLGMTIAVPIFLWIFIWCVGKLTDQGSMASLDILNSNPKEREKMEKALQEEMQKENKGVGQD